MTEAAGGASVAASTLLARIPDEPRWVDLRGLLCSGEGEIFAAGDGGAVVLSRDLAFIALWERPERRDLEAAVAVAPVGELDVLVPNALAEEVARWLPSWKREAVVLHRAPQTWDSAGGEGGEVAGVDLIRLDATVPCDRSPWQGESRREIDWLVATGRPASAAVVDGVLAAFCAAPVATERLWDVSVATLPRHRRRGLAAACFHHLRRRQAAKQPVWGARADNIASLRLAARLGFVPDARLTVFSRPAAA